MDNDGQYVIIAVTGGPYDRCIDTGIQGAVIRHSEYGECFVVPFSTFDNAIDCLRIVIRALERHRDGEGDFPPPDAVN
jgi:hypothetical protein